MFNFQLSGGCEGFVLIGSYPLLRKAYAVASEISETADIHGEDDFFLALAYDLRKAFSGSREVYRPPEESPEIGLRFGVKMLWPTILVQTKILRACLSCTKINAGHQAIAYALEDVVQNAIKSEFKDNSSAVESAWTKIDVNHVLSRDKAISRSAAFLGWSEGKRRQFLPHLLDSLHPMYERSPEMWQGLGVHLHPDTLNRAKFL